MNTPDDTSTPLAPQQRALLTRLADGETIAAAAAAEFLSLRTANRRIAQARRTLGVTTTREAVAEYVRRYQDAHPADIPARLGDGTARATRHATGRRATHQPQPAGTGHSAARSSASRSST